MRLRHDMLAHGVNVVCAEHGEKRGGLAIAWATQVGTERVLICVGSQSRTRGIILESGAFGVSVLAADQIETARLFGRTSGKETDKFDGLAWHAGETGSPLLDDCITTLDCRVEEVHDRGEAKLIIGRIVSAERRRETCVPLVYREEDY